MARPIVTSIWLVIVRWAKIKELHLHATAEGARKRAKSYLADSPEVARALDAWDGYSVIDVTGVRYRVAIILAPIAP